MRVLVLGGTRFIGRAIVDELLSAGMEVVVCHRGRSEPEGLPEVPHLHADRTSLTEVRDEIARLESDAVVDCYAMGREDTSEVLDSLPDRELRLVVLSSGDVYRAYHGLHHGIPTDAVPLDENAPVREQLYPYKGQFPDHPEMDSYEKLEVEQQYLERAGTVLRLPAVYGEHDYQRREWFILRRVRAGRRRIPIGGGSFLFSRCYVGDVARGVRLALSSPEAAAQIFNLSERATASMALLARRILDAAGWEAELVRVADEALPPDLQITANTAQHLLLDASKARDVLGWSDGDPDECLERTVAWHLEHPPEESGDFGADDRALAPVAG